MTTKIMATQTQQIEVSIDVFKIPETLLAAFNWDYDNDHDRMIKITEDALWLYEDMSYHGSPNYQPTRLLTDNPLEIKLYQQIKDLQQTMKEIKKAQNIA